MSVITDLFTGASESQARRERVEGFDQGIGEQQRFAGQTREDFAGFRERGGLAGEEEAALLGLRGSEAESAALGRFSESPGQAFLRQRQERSLLRNEAAIGGLGGGNVRTALQEQAFGIASTQLGERKDRLAGVAGRGLGAITSGAQIGANISGNLANLFTGRGEARAGGTEAVANRRRSSLLQVAKAFI